VLTSTVLLFKAALPGSDTALMARLGALSANCFTDVLLLDALATDFADASLQQHDLPKMRQLKQIVEENHKKKFKKSNRCLLDRIWSFLYIEYLHVAKIQT
jgi:hypothetical protein